MLHKYTYIVNNQLSHKYTYIVNNQLSITVENSLFIIILPTCITPTTSRLKLKTGTVPGKDLSMHYVKMRAVF